MAPKDFPLRWESTRDQWWFASPIDWAAANGHYDLVKELLNLDPNLLIKLTSLGRIRRLESLWDDENHTVARSRSRVARKLLLESESRPRKSLIRAGYGGWLLYTAASAGDQEFVKELIDREPMLVFGEGEYGVNDFFYSAARSKNPGVFRLLMSQCCEGKNGDGFEKKKMVHRAVHAAARGGNVEILEEILKGNCCFDVLDCVDDDGASLLHSASGRGQVEVVKSLLASYDMINCRDKHGNTALHVSAYRGYLPVVEALISSSPSSVSLTNDHGDTFLHLAVAGFGIPSFRRLDRQTELMKQLVSGKFAKITEEIVNVRNNDGRTALHMAVMENNNVHTCLVELLMTVRWIDLNVCDGEGCTPLDLLKQQHPRSASSEILIKRLVSAGGVSNNVIRTVSVKPPQCMIGSPGTSFRISADNVFDEMPQRSSSHDSGVAASNVFDEMPQRSSSHNSVAAATNVFDEMPQRSHHSHKSGVLAASNVFDEMPQRSSSHGSVAASNVFDEMPQRSHHSHKSGVIAASNVFDEMPQSSPSHSDSNKKLPPVSSPARRLKDLMHRAWRKEAIKQDIESYEQSLSSAEKPIPLRQRFSSTPSVRDNQETTTPSVSPSPPSPLSFKKKFASMITHSPFGSPSSPFSGSSYWASPASTSQEKSGELGNPANVKMFHNGEKWKMKRKYNSFNITLVNKYLCFGTQGLPTEHPVF